MPNGSKEDKHDHTSLRVTRVVEYGLARMCLPCTYARAILKFGCKVVFLHVVFEKNELHKLSSFVNS